MQIVRKFIADSLYSSAGYFSRSVISSPAPIKFSGLRGQAEWVSLQRRIYREQSRWLTPSVLFQPFYGHAIANWLISRQATSIVEVGGGTGALALSICDHLARSAPQLYKHFSYTLIDISPSLRSQQRRALAHHPVANVISTPVFDSNVDTILMAEVLDNTPHDRLVVHSDGSIYETWINSDAEEVLLPLSDPLCQNLIERVGSHMLVPPHASSIFGRLLASVSYHTNKLFPSSVWWAPTGCLELMSVLTSAYPNASMWISDFDSLPSPVHGCGSPVVQSLAKGRTTVYQHYIQEQGMCDIMFGTNFDLLSDLIHSLTAKTSDIQSHSQWFRRLSPSLLQTKTQSGFNPLVDDFQNVSVLTSR